MRSIAKSNDALLRYAVISLIAVALAAVTGRLAVHTVNDSPSYLNYPLGSLRDAMLSIRTPGYPILLALITGTLGLLWVPLAQVLLHATACWYLIEELLHRDMPVRSALLAGFCVLIGCTAADHINTISTDAPAASLGLIAAVALMAVYRTGRTSNLVLCATITSLAIFVRPAYLFLIPWIAIAGYLLGNQHRMITPSDDDRGRTRLQGVKIAIAVGAVVLGWMALRKAVVSDFAIAPFGHQNLSAVLVQTVTPETLRSLPGESGEFGNMIADELQSQGFQLPSETGGPLPTMTLESQWDVINYSVVWPLARDRFADRDASALTAPQVSVHRRIGQLNRAILSEAPLGYIRWLLLAVRRGVWGVAADIAMHPVFLAMILFGLIRILYRVSTAAAFGPIAIPAGWSAFALVAISYAFCSIGFVILSSPPLGRFADAGAIMLPALIASLLATPGSRFDTAESDVRTGR